MATENQPFVGPRPFERTDQSHFFGRDGEAADLLSLIIAHPVVLLYAQSGAGKSSLLNALVVPLLEQQCLDVLPQARVRGEVSTGGETDQIANIYMFHAINSWLNKTNQSQVERLTVAEFLTARQRMLDDEGNPRPRVLIFDQFEELFTFYQERWQDREPFFQQIREALEADRMLRVVFAMREDYIAMLDPYKAILQGKLRTRYRLERLRKNAALLAATAPLRGTGRQFADGVAEQLVESLLKVRIKSESKLIEVTGEYVEPLHLQVVCQRLWEGLAPDESLITANHLVASGDVEQALSGFYDQAIKDVAEQTKVGSAILQGWFQNALLTRSGTRKIVYRGATETEGLNNTAVDLFEDLHLIRGEWRDGSRCYELAHDRFIEPIRTSNRRAASLGDAEATTKVMAKEKSKQFFRAGGTLGPDAPTYVIRQADNALLEGLIRGDLCYILTSRQYGKSSLLVRIAHVLRQQGFRTVIMDLTMFGPGVSSEQWHYGILDRLGDQFELDDELRDFWQKNEYIAPAQRLFAAIRELILPMSEAPLIWFIDELDIVHSLNFATDDFFVGIRSCYNRRADDPLFDRLTFCLSGVAQPQDLIRDPLITPFNIGRRIELSDFTPEEAAPLAQGLMDGNRKGEQLLQRVLYWTGGHPYLTQRLCAEIARHQSATSAADVDRLCNELFLSKRAFTEDNNLVFIGHYILNNGHYSPNNGTVIANRLALYSQIRRGRRVPDDPTNPLIGSLKLSGIVRADNGYLQIRNRIYSHVFDKRWISEHMPDSETLRERAAYRSSIVRYTVTAGVAGAILCALSYTTIHYRNEAGKLRQEMRLVQQKMMDAQKQAMDQAGQLHRAAQLAEQRRRDAEATARDLKAQLDARK